jgi:hypothetical protein
MKKEKLSPEETLKKATSLLKTATNLIESLHKAYHVKDKIKVVTKK